jgi:hypothetical protein
MRSADAGFRGFSGSAAAGISFMRRKSSFDPRLIFSISCVTNEGHLHFIVNEEPRFRLPGPKDDVTLQPSLSKTPVKEMPKTTQRSHRRCAFASLHRG